MSAFHGCLRKSSMMSLERVNCSAGRELGLARDFGLLAGGEVLHCQDTGGLLVFAEDSTMLGRALVSDPPVEDSLLECRKATVFADSMRRPARRRRFACFSSPRAGALRLSPTRVQRVSGVAFKAQRMLLGADSCSAGCSGCDCNVRIRRSSPMAKPMPGSFGPAEHFRQAVVAPAAEHRVLRAQAAVGELEGGAGVVVEAAHHAWVDLHTSRRRRRGPRVPRRSGRGDASSR
jgi:hypothetical protein